MKLPPQYPSRTSGVGTGGIFIGIIDETKEAGIVYKYAFTDGRTDLVHFYQ
jgi:hypothetical protein